VRQPTNNFFNTVVRVTPDGLSETLLTFDDGLDGPSAAAFGVRKDKKNLHITNVAYPVFLGQDPRRPSLLRLHIGIPGEPQP
jgi:hypothetical protein